MAALLVVPRFLIHYAVQPMPEAVVLEQILSDTASVLIMAIVVAPLNSCGGRIGRNRRNPREPPPGL